MAGSRLHEVTPPTKKDRTDSAVPCRQCGAQEAVPGVPTGLHGHSHVTYTARDNTASSASAAQRQVPVPTTSEVTTLPTPARVEP